MRASMSSRDRRAVGLGLAVLVPALLYIWAVRPYLARLDDARQEVAAQRDALSREEAAIAAQRQDPGFHHVADSAMQALINQLRQNDTGFQEFNRRGEYLSPQELDRLSVELVTKATGGRVYFA